jgi:hypothetical protein
MPKPPTIPICPNHPERKLWAIISRKTSVNALSTDHDTPIWFCPDCGFRRVRIEETEKSE